MPGCRWGSKGKGAAGRRAGPFQMVWLLVTALTTSPRLLEPSVIQVITWRLQRKCLGAGRKGLVQVGKESNLFPCF